MILENIRDKKLLELYKALTRSDFKGTMNDNYVIRLLYSTMVFDLKANSSAHSYNETHSLQFGKELIRVYDEKTYDELDNWSIELWCEALLRMIEVEGLSYQDIHKLNARELKLKIAEYKEEN